MARCAPDRTRAERDGEFELLLRQACLIMILIEILGGEDESAAALYDAQQDCVLACTADS